MRYWPDPARRTHWLGAGVAADWPFGPFPLKTRESNWFYPLAMKTWPFMCPDPCTLYTVQSRHEWRSSHWTNSQTHKRKLDASQHLSVGFDIWFEGYETNYWCFIIFRQNFFRAKLVTSREKKKQTQNHGHPHTYKARVNQAHQADVLWCVRLGGSRFEFIY